MRTHSTTMCPHPNICMSSYSLSYYSFLQLFQTWRHYYYVSSHYPLVCALVLPHTTLSLSCSILRGRAPLFLHAPPPMFLVSASTSYSHWLLACVDTFRCMHF